MERFRDYCGFIALFVGLGYLALTASGYAAQLAPGLHAIGMGAAVLAAARMTRLALRARGNKPGSATMPAAAPRVASEQPRTWPQVKPRKQFGLRDVRR